jgi:phosphoribosyl-ATP pyrophosphohydrolase
MTTLEKLATTIASRQGQLAETSYTAKLLHSGTEKCAKKFGEEAFELAMAAVLNNKANTTNEAADVFYHLLVLLQSSGVALSDVMAVLEKREGTSGLVEKANRSG